MVKSKAFLRSVILFFLTLSLVIISFHACDRSPSGNFFLGKLPQVEALLPPELPDWIEEISPQNEGANLAQIRVRFKHPLIPVERLDTDQQRKILQKFEVVPPIPGQFRFLTPKLVGFQADQAIPSATRLRVTLREGLGDLENNQLAADLAWTFNTAPIELSDLPGETLYPGYSPAPIALQEPLGFTANMPLDLASVENHSFFVDGQGRRQGVTVTEIAEDEPEPSIDDDNPFDWGDRAWRYQVTPKAPLKKGTTYQLEFSPGIQPMTGNLASDRRFSTELNTFAALTFQEMRSGGAGQTGGRFTNGSPELVFNNGLVADNVREQITITPANPDAPGPVLRTYDGSEVVAVNPYALEPNQNYTITINGGLSDRYGQTLGRTIQLQYRTGDLVGDLWAPTGINIFPAVKDVKLHVDTVNLPDRRYELTTRVISPTDLIYGDSPYPSDRPTDLLPASHPWRSQPVDQQKNIIHSDRLPLKEILGQDTGMVAYGVRAKTHQFTQNGQQQWHIPEYYGLAQLTNLGVFAQWFPEGGFVKVNHLDDGSAAANVTVTIYPAQINAPQKTNPLACATGISDRQGFFSLSTSQWNRCRGPEDQAPDLVVIAQENQDWAYVHSETYSGAYGYGIYADWEDGPSMSRGALFSDRQLYQPGEKAWFTGVAYYLDQGQLKVDRQGSFQVQLIDPQGETRNLGRYRTNDYGTFGVELDLDPQQALGNYYLEAQGDRGYGFGVDFQVEQFRPPNFKVDVTLGESLVTRNAEVMATTQGDYLFGAPVQGAQVDYYVTRQKTDFRPPNWENFQFGRQWFWPEESPEVNSEVLQSRRILDQTGKNQEVFRIGADLPYPMAYRVEAQVKDVANQMVSARGLITALPSDRLIGLDHDWIATSGQDFPVKVVVSDPQGQAIANESVTLALQKITYSEVGRLEAGSRTTRNQVEYDTVATQTLKTSTQPQTLNLAITEPGAYRLQANFSQGDEGTATETQIWATGSGSFFWGDRYQNNRLEVQLDKPKYRIGDKARVLIQSPYEAGELYFAVIRRGVISSQVIPVKGSAPEVEFTVTAAMLPNAAVEAVLIRQGESLATDDQPLDKLAKVGFAPFETDLGDRYLELQVTPQRQELAPGDRQTVNLQVTRQGRPVQAEMRVMVVNDGVLQLNGYRPPDLVEKIYGPQPITTRWEDSRSLVKLEAPPSPLAKGWGYDGGFSQGLADTRIRGDFQAWAHYGTVESDRSGRAQVSFTLPEDLTTWRILAIAVDQTGHFGRGENSFMAKKPLMANPLLPAFVRLGDHFWGGLTLTNTTTTQSAIDVEGGTADTLQFTKTQAPNLKLREKNKPGTTAYRWEMEAIAPGEGTVTWAARMNATLNDGFSVPLVVKPLGTTESVITTGTTEDRITIPLAVDRQVDPQIGGFNLTLASDLIPALKTPGRSPFSQADFPLLETAASDLAMAASLVQLDRQYKNVFGEWAPETQAPQAITQLENLQFTDGGFSFYPGQDGSDPLVSAYAAQAIALAQTVFPTQSRLQTWSQDLRAYFDQVIQNPNQFDFCQTARCKRQLRLQGVVALQALGVSRNEYVGDIFDHRRDLDVVDQLQLARYLQTQPDWQREATQLAADLQELIYDTGRSAVVNIPERWRWFHSPVVLQAQALELALAQGRSPAEMAPLVQGLINLQRDGHWGNSYDNARAFMAIAHYGRQSATPPNFQATITLDRKTLAQAQFQGFQTPSYDLTIPMAQLPRGNQELTVAKSGSGTLHYVGEYGYRLQGSQPGRLNGLRITRYLRKANQREVLAQLGLYSGDDPITVAAGQVFDVDLEIITDHPVNHVLITDPLPAGFEAVDSGFLTSPDYFQAQSDSWAIGYEQIYSDRIQAYGDYLGPGVYHLHYLVRSVTPGEFEYPGAEVHLKYAPEEFGRSASVKLQVTD